MNCAERLIGFPAWLKSHKIRTPPKAPGRGGGLGVGAKHPGGFSVGMRKNRSYLYYLYI